MPDPVRPTIDQLRSALLVAPFHQWLQLDVVASTPEGLHLRMPWRADVVSNPRQGSAHGGVLAALIDLAGFYALLAAGQPVAATANLNIDYHRPAIGGPLEVHARVVKAGKRISVASADVLTAQGVLLAAGRGAYLTPT